jgi:hypothetical protein
VIPRKWEWVQEQCIRRGFKKAAKLAGEIDAVLLDCYDVKHTRDWEVFCERNKREELVDRGTQGTGRFFVNVTKGRSW